MAEALVTKQVTDGVAVITMNRPDVLNSFNIDMSQQLQSAINDSASDPAIRTILLTGAGRGFCAGQDLAEVLPRDGEPLPDLGEFVDKSYTPVVLALRNAEKPVVCAVNGIAAGAGANLAMVCDIVFASDKASFVQSFCKIGVVPDTGGTWFLPRIVGLQRANAMMMLGEKVSAEKALEYGMIYKVSPNDDLMEEAMACAKHLATQPTAGLGLLKRALNRTFDNDLQAQLMMERRLQSLAGKTDDYAEGVAAFLEKRKPKFKGS